jgi:hypothetical protein
MLSNHRRVWEVTYTQPVMRRALPGCYPMDWAVRAPALALPASQGRDFDWPSGLRPFRLLWRKALCVTCVSELLGYVLPAVLRSCLIRSKTSSR